MWHGVVLLIKNSITLKSELTLYVSLLQQWIDRNDYITFDLLSDGYCNKLKWELRCYTVNSL